MAYKKDMCSDGNLMLFNIFEILFPNTVIEQLNITKYGGIILRTYNNTSIPQISICRAPITHRQTFDK